MALKSLMSAKKEKKPRKEGIRQAMRLFGYMRPYKKHFNIALAALFVTAGLSLVFPYMMGKLIGGSMGKSEVDAGNVASNINWITGTLLGVLGLQAFIAYWRVKWFAKAGECALADIRRDVYGRLVRMPMTYFSEHRVGELSSRIATDLTMLRDTLIQTVPQMVRQSVMLVGGVILILISSVKLTMFMLATLPVIILAVAIFGRKIRKWSRDAQDQLAETNVVVEETLQGIANVKAFSNEKFESARYQRGLDRFIDTTLMSAGARALFVSFIIFAVFGVITLVIWFGAGMLIKGTITDVQFAHFVLFSIFVGASLGSLPEILSQIQKALGATERVREILDAVPEDLGEEVKGERLKGKVEMKNVVFSYPSRKDIRVLDGVNLIAEAGQRIALVGPSGAGKSTVIAQLLRFYDPESGVVEFDGKPASEYPLGFLRSQMALVPQEVLLFGGSIRENIAYGRTDATEAEIFEAAKRANASEFIESFPEGYDTLVGDRGVKLSGGQRQRIAIARAILADPAILIMDEATSSLDSESERLVHEALEELMKGRTSIIIAHRLSTVRQADLILVLKDGKTIESGTHDELVEREKGIYRMLSELQMTA
jgi:ABC-type multidrug transport system fused ATPase/permease subunit